MNSQQINLNGGEVTPYLAHRTDIEKHGTSLLACHNFLPMPFGGVRKRPGTQYLRTLTQASNNSRMLAFHATDGERYILIFTPTHLLCYRRSSESVSATISLSWPMTDALMSDLRFHAVNDVVYICAPHFHPLQLSYFSPSTWSVSPLNWKFSPITDQNLLDANRITVLSNPVATSWANATAYTVGTIRLGSDGTREYECTVAHTSATATNSPGVGSAWETVWKPVVYTAGASVTLRTFLGVTTWSLVTAYPQGSYVLHSGIYYVAKVAIASGIDPTSTLGLTQWQRLTSAFSASHIGTSTTFSPNAQLYIKQNRLDSELSSTIIAIASNDAKASPPILVSGAWDFQTFGEWDGTFSIQRSYNNGLTWSTGRSFSGSKDNNVSSSGTEDTTVLMRILFEKDGSTFATGKQRAVLTPRNGDIGGRILLSAFTSATVMTGTALESIPSGTTYKWSETAFSPKNGYPSALALHENRLIFGGTRSKPTALWFSSKEDFLDFFPDTKDSDAFWVALATSNANDIQWLASQRRLYIGCQYSEWVIGSETSDSEITPTNFRAREYTFFGSSHREALRVGDAIVFAQRNDNRIREMAFDDAAQSYSAADLTRLAEHLFISGSADLTIRSMAWQESREPMMWVTRKNGTLLTFTYSRSENIAAWASHSTASGSFLSVCVAPTTADDDEIYFLCSRPSTVGGTSPVVTLERIAANAHKLSESAPGLLYPSQLVPAVLDCLDYNSILTYTENTPGHSILPTDAVRCRYVHSTTTGTGTNYPEFAAIPIAAPAGRYAVGIPITAYIETLPLEAATQTGSSIGRKKRGHKARAHIRQGALLQACQNISQSTAANNTLAHWSLVTMAPVESLRYNLTDQNTSGLYSGWVEANIVTTGQTITLGLLHNATEVITLTALVTEYEIHQA